MPRTLLVLGCLSAVAIGCGSSGEDVIAKADNLCKEAQEKQLTLLDGTSSNSKNPKVMKAYLKSSLEQTRDLNTQLEKLAPPADQEEKWNAWIASLGEQEQSANKLIGTVKGGMVSGKATPYLTALNDSIAEQQKRNKLATKLGLKTCGHNTSI